MLLLGKIIFVVYFIALLYITLYCLLQLHLLFHYNRDKNQVPKIKDLDSAKKDKPLVTIQLPIFNEQYVVERLIDNIIKIDYPKDKIEIQVLDDSTDETLEISRKKVNEFKKLGYNIKLMTRKNRTGYKAGALKDAMPYVNGDFVAIFDADFLPQEDFLNNTLPYFNDSSVGVVQTRWDHINQDYSLLTELQAFQLNVHFTIEQLGRYHANYLLQFNGTAGVWRRETIDSSGGWEADTLTEDLDLSYRAQLKGWKIIYLEDVLSPAELPSEMHGFKSQQFRWMKGGAETARKMLPSIWNSDLSFTKKLHATGHLLGSSVFIFVFMLGIFSVPLLYFFKPMDMGIKYQQAFLIGLISIVAVYFTANVKKAWKSESSLKMIFKFLVLFPVFLSLSMGLSFHNTVAVIQGFRGKKSSFIRTPKFDIKTIKDKLSNHKYLTKKIGFTTMIEGALALYFAFAVYFGITLENYSLTLFHILLTIGYGSIFFYSVKHVQFK